MKRLYKSLIIATIPLSYVVAGASMGYAVGLCGAEKLLLAAVCVGAFFYPVLIVYLLQNIEDQKKENIRLYRIINRWENRHN